MIKYNQVKFDSIDEGMRSMIRRNAKETSIDTRPNVDSEAEIGQLPLHEATTRNPRDADLTRQAGDFSLYIFYLRSIGPVFALALAILATLFTIFRKMPR